MLSVALGVRGGAYLLAPHTGVNLCRYDGAYERRFSVVTTTTVLLRAVVRLCAADGAVVESGRDLVTVGLGADAALALLASIRSGAPLPSGRALMYQTAIPLERTGTVAILSIVESTARPLDPAVRAAVDVIATEIGSQLDLQTVGERERMSPSLGDHLGQLAAGIDWLNEAAAIFEWPRIGALPRILYVNRAFESLFGFEAAATIGETSEFLHGPLTDLTRLQFVHDRVRATREARSPIVYYRRGEIPVWIELSLRAVPGQDDRAWCMVATLRDVTTRKEFEHALAKEKRKLQVTLAAIGDGVITTVADGRVDFVNAAARAIFGIDAAEAYGEPIGRVLRLTDSHSATIDVLCGESDHAGVCRGQALFERGRLPKHIAFVTAPIAAEGYVVVLRDVSAQHRLATQLTYEASHDPLTSMYNRRKFDELLVDAIEAAQRGEGPHALAFLDLDRFKIINDMCGHAVGDRVLLDLAHLSQQQLRGRDVLARIGGDEFAVLLHECSLENARRVLEKLRQAVESYRYNHHDCDYGVGVSIGIATIDGSETDAAAIFRRADAACYAAKSGGRNAIAG